MNATPTSGPIASSSTHHARDANSSRHSLRSSQRKATAERTEIAEKEFFSVDSVIAAVASSRERKKDLFQVVAGRAASGRGDRGQFLERSLAARATAAQQHESIADPSGIANLVNRQEHRPAGGGVRPQRGGDVAALP